MSNVITIRELRPISKKRSYRRGKHGGFYLSKSYKNWEEQALWQLKSYKQKYTGKVHISFEFEMKGKLDTDLDNAVTSCLDVLQAGQIIDNDKNVASLEAVKYHGFKDWVTKIRIKSLEKENK